MLNQIGVRFLGAEHHDRKKCPHRFDDDTYRNAFWYNYRQSDTSRIYVDFRYCLGCMYCRAFPVRMPVQAEKKEAVYHEPWRVYSHFDNGSCLYSMVINKSSFRSQRVRMGDCLYVDPASDDSFADCEHL